MGDEEEKVLQRYRVKKYYEANRERIRQKHRDYYCKNIDKECLRLKTQYQRQKYKRRIERQAKYWSIERRPGMDLVKVMTRKKFTIVLDQLISFRCVIHDDGEKNVYVCTPNTAIREHGGDENYSCVLHNIFDFISNNREADR